MKLLLHTCCAPCSVYCIDTLKKDNIDITSYWYNPNIHPYIEYKERLNTLKNYTKSIDIPLIIDDYYGLRQFCKNVVDKLDNRCGYCYYSRLEKTAIYAKEHGFDAFSTTLLISPYQNHELLKKTGEIIEKKYNIKFLYEDFRPGFKKGYEKARSLGLYIQKYCGCIFSEEERYIDEIIKNKEKEFSIKLIKPSTMFKNEIIEYINKNLDYNVDKKDDFDTLFLNRLKEKYKDNYIYTITYLIIRKSDNKLLGIIEFRPDLNDFFLKNGGNVSYSIAYNNYEDEIIKLIILMGQKYRKNKILITCDKNDILFEKAIINNNGYLESSLSNNTKRYLINVNNI